jgi:TldD protein
MARRRKIALLTSLLLTLAICASPLVRAQSQGDVVMHAMKDELARSMSDLQLQKMEKPYFIAYRVLDATQDDITASLGSLTSSSGPPTRRRAVAVELRVGDYSVDNSNFISMRSLESMGMLGGIQEGSLDADYAQIRRELWLATDAQYKSALENLSAKRAALKGQTGGDNIPDFSKETPKVWEELTSTPVPSDFGPLQAVARELSAVFRSSPDIDRSSVSIKYTNVYTRYLNSEGTSFTRSDPLIKLEVSAQTRASDGLPISDSFDVFARTPADLPATTSLRERVQQMAAVMLRLRSASALDRYNGPVLFEGTAAGEIFLEQLGPRFGTSKTPMSDTQQFEMIFSQLAGRMGGASFQDKIGARVLPDFISVRDDPAQTAFGGVALMGTSTVDDDGVGSRQTTLVERGVLKNLVASRAPVRGALQSTGSRRSWGAVPGNLFVTSDKTLSADDLKKELLRRAKDRGLDYALVVRRVGAGSGASLLDLAQAMASSQTPTQSVAEIYKLYPDGHEELIRGVHMSDFSTDAFKDIAATGDAPSVYTAELMPPLSSLISVGLSMAFSSDSDLPIVSCVCPSLLFDDVSLIKNEGPYPKGPVSPSPLAEK